MTFFVFFLYFNYNIYNLNRLKFSDNELFICEEALDHFIEIVNTIGGPGEKSRANEFIKRLTIVKGIDHLKVKHYPF